MSSKKSAEQEAGELRRRAEAISREYIEQMPEMAETLSTDAARALFHELRVHEIELEMQNENLRRTQEKLNTARERYFDLYEQAPTGYFLLNAQGLIMEANLTFASMLGMEKSSLLDQPLSEFIFPEDQDVYYLHSQLLLEEGTAPACELRLVKNDGSQFWIRLEENLVREKGEVTMIRAMVSDINESKRAQEELAESEARYRAVIDQASEAVLICDPDTGEILETNACFTNRLGYDLQQDGKLNLFELVIDESETCQDILSRGTRTGTVPLQRRLFRHRRGNIVSVERTATLVHYRGRSLFVVTLRDVSEEVRREQEILRDAQLATRVQNALLAVPEPSDHIRIDTIFQPYGYVGGDLYFLDWRYDGSLLRGFLIDATGHGLSTALHTASLHVLLREVNERDLTLHNAINWLNRRVGEYFDEGTFAGALGFELDLETRQLRVTCAGIPKVWIATKTQAGVFECPGMSLGIHEDETFDTHRIPLEVGDSFYFMTDGLSDMLAGRTEMPVDQYPEMVALLRTISESEERRDDATAVCIHIHSLPQSHFNQDGWPKLLRFNGFGDYDRMKEEVAKILEEVTSKAHSIQEVAVSEALANAMECRDGVPRQHKAMLRINKVGNRLIVRVKTSRIGFAGNAILRRLRSHPEDMFSFGEDASMGRGLPMMLSMSHYMTYNSEGTEVLLAWKLKK